MARFLLTSTWQVPTTAEDLWPVLWDVESWPAWWPYVASSRVVADGDRLGHGRRTHLVFRTPLGYRLSFGVEVVTIRPPFLVEARVAGQLTGRGLWELRATAGGVATDITWDVETRRPWMRTMSPVAAPVFRAAHGHVMAAGERGLVRVMDRPEPVGRPVAADR